jgi:hypothetical protein
MRWLALLGLIALQVGCAARDVRCAGPLRPINTAAATLVAPPPPQHTSP